MTREQILQKINELERDLAELREANSEYNINECDVQSAINKIKNFVYQDINFIGKNSEDTEKYIEKLTGSLKTYNQNIFSSNTNKISNKINKIEIEIENLKKQLMMLKD